MPETIVTTPRIVVPHRPKWHQRVAAFAVWGSLRLVALTLRCKWTDRSGLFEGPAPASVIYCSWHNRLALSMVAYFHYAQDRGRRPDLAVMVSASRDGGFLTAILEFFGVRPVRGSSSRRGAQALRELTTWARRGHDLGITPDGPRGPCYTVQDGVVALAQLSGLPIVPFSFHLRWKIRIRSWDRFQIPLPFSRCEFILGKAIRVPRDTSPADRETFRLQLENEMKSITVD